MAQERQLPESSEQALFDLIVVGAGAAGIMAAIRAAENGKRVLLLEKLPRIAAKLKATGGGRCNLTNTLDNERFMKSFGREGRFMTTALEGFDHHALTAFFHSIGVETHAPDGFRIFPITHSSLTIIRALEKRMEALNIEVYCHSRIDSILHDTERVYGVRSAERHFHAPNIVISTGGKGYPMLGTEGDGYSLAESVGHTITPLYPAMMPLKAKERWVTDCRADTIPGVQLIVDLKKYRKLKATGDLIFTRDGIRGPVVLDFSREITPLLATMNEVPLKMNLTGGMNEEEVRIHFKKILASDPHRNTLELVRTLLPESLSRVLCRLSDIDPSLGFNRQPGRNRDALIRLLAWTPLTITGHDGFSKAMITRGGISLREIDPKTMQSRKLEGLYFCGEVMNLDGPCGGYNLQWSFASGYLAGELRTDHNSPSSEKL